MNFENLRLRVARRRGRCRPPYCSELQLRIQNVPRRSCFYSFPVSVFRFMLFYFSTVPTLLSWYWSFICPIYYAISRNYSEKIVLTGNRWTRKKIDVFPRRRSTDARESLGRFVYHAIDDDLFSVDYPRGSRNIICLLIFCDT